MDFCTDYNFLKALTIVNSVLNIICVIVPVIIVIVTTVSIVKAVLSDDENAMKALPGIVTKRILLGVAIFMMPTIILSIITTVNSNSKKSVDLYTCLNNSKNLNYYKDLKEKEEKQESESKKKENTTPVAIPTNEIKNKTEPDLEPNKETTVGTLYSLSPKQLNYLAAVCQKENGYTKRGMMAEATLILNRYQNADKLAYPNIAYYVRNARWWSTAADAENVTPSQEAIDAVKSVIAYGNRIYPSYVIEHAGYSNVAFIVTNGKKISDYEGIHNINNYIKDNTIIYEVGHESDNDVGWWFYDFPCERCDPFGYYKSDVNNYAPRFNSWS